MNINLIQSAVGNVLEWVIYMFYLNILWILFTLVGLVIFGWMPATIATYATWRKLLRHKDEIIPIFKTFFSEYKYAFVKKNIVGLIVLAGGFLVWFYLSLYQHTEGVFNVFYTGFLFLILVFFLNLIIYLPPVMVHFKLKFFQYFRQALIFGFASPMITFLFYMGIALWLISLYNFPVLLLPFGFSALSLFIMKGCLHRFQELGF